MFSQQVLPRMMGDSAIMDSGGRTALAFSIMQGQ
jgi:hypothetical protein